MNVLELFEWAEKNDVQLFIGKDERGGATRVAVIEGETSAVIFIKHDEVLGSQKDLIEYELEQSLLMLKS